MCVRNNNSEIVRYLHSIMSQGRSYKTVRPRKFTFHYVSILIGVLSCLVCRIFLFTFHYVSILIKAPSAFNTCAGVFTFHYVSILIKNVVQYTCTDEYIYIPLCLYFNENINKIYTANGLYLHSIMSLF